MIKTLYDLDLNQGIEYLQSRDARLGTLINGLEVCSLTHHPPRTTLLEAIAWGIIGQQINTNTAQMLFQRFLDYAQPKGWTPENLANVDPESFRSLGISRYKTRYLKIWAIALQNDFPPLFELETWDDLAIVERLTAIKGIGPWTAQLFLLFRLRRQDILPNQDLGIRIAIQKLYQLPDRPNPKQVFEYGENWQPYRSLASWYLWRSLSPTVSQIHL
ncbi:DNA-3-methyladenine glycosylase 2 family protein [Synechocystis sp. FACHB-383]|uniref:DNA-3-methyladenine glycosylase family protein n=1 Tax=Synechocystis sp. FACHB-383 TaxID=2692864 RepID=UPI001684B9DA|nr:DNA-3-methyladenine glycosylase [Synechocystis sp. FACHB-383]MBD2653778.1 DNA-3-methyladenine glycosylase 2 family protein [Synechocystis sp. FACHB-383]